MARTLFAAALALSLAAPALAQTAGPIQTAPAKDAPLAAAAAQGGADAPVTTGDHAVLTTSEQIDRFIRDGEEQAPPGEDPNAPRKIHGEAGASIGTGGYRSAYVAAEIPVGKTGTVGIAVSQGQFGGHGRWGGRRWSGGSIAISGSSDAATEQAP